MDLGLTGDVAVVVGGASGLGHAIAAGFAAEGAQVVLLDVSPKVHEVAASFARSAAYVADVTDYAAVKGVAAGSGRVDHVVFAAGVGSGKFGFPFWNREELPESLGCLAF